MRKLVAILCGLSAAACATAFETPRNRVNLGEDGYTLTRAPMQSAREQVLSIYRNFEAWERISQLAADPLYRELITEVDGVRVRHDLLNPDEEPTPAPENTEPEGDGL